MIKLWKDLLFPNDIIVRKITDPQELQAISKSELLKAQGFILRHQGVSIQVLPEFNAPLIKSFILDYTMLKYMKSFAQSTHENLESFQVTFHKQLREIHLVEAPKLERLVVKYNQKSLLLNIERLATYSKIKRIQIEQVTFVSIYSQKDLIKRDEETVLKDMKAEQNEKLQEKQSFQEKEKIAQKPLKMDFKYKHYAKVERKKKKVETQKKQELKEQNQNISRAIIRYNEIPFMPRLSLDNVSELICFSNKIKSIQWFSKGNYPNLKVVNFSDNQIEVLQKLDIPLATEIKFSSNSIMEVSQFFQIVYPSVLIMNLEKNKIKDIQKITCPKLRELILNQNNLKKIPILNTPNLQILYANQNIIWQVSELSNPELKLIHLDLSENQIFEIPVLNPERFQSINLSHNTIFKYEHLGHGEFPFLKNLNLSYQADSIANLQLAKFILPLFKMPKLQNLDLKMTFLDDMTEFFKGEYPSLRDLDLGTCQNHFQLPKLNMPNLEKLNMSNTAISDVFEFSQGYYPKLTDLKLSEKLVLLKGASSEANIEQFSCARSNKNPIMITKFGYDSEFFNNYLQGGLLRLKIDATMTTSVEFLSFLNLSGVRYIHLYNCRVDQSLSKVKLNSQKQNLRIRFDNLTNLNIIHFTHLTRNYTIGKKFIRIPSSDKWRRAYRPQNPVWWEFNGRTSPDFNFRDFQYGLRGRNLRRTLKFCRRMNQENRSQNRHLRPRPRMVEAYK